MRLAWHACSTRAGSTITSFSLLTLHLLRHYNYSIPALHMATIAQEASATRSQAVCGSPAPPIIPSELAVIGESIAKVEGDPLL